MPESVSQQLDRSQPLVHLGFTGLEADVYAFLIRESPATGYRIAQALGRPVGSIYKAVEGLEAKGAILTTDDGENRLARAVPIAEMLDRLEHEFQTRRQAAADAFVASADVEDDERVYQLHSREQFYARCRAMLARARAFALLSIGPTPLQELSADLAATTARGVAVGVKAFAPCEVPGAEMVLDPRGMTAIENGPGQWMSLTIDGAEFTLALFTPDGASLHQATWSASAFLSWLFFTGLSSDFVLAAIKTALANGADADGLRALLARLTPFESPRSLGKLALNRRYRGATRPRQRG